MLFRWLVLSGLTYGLILLGLGRLRGEVVVLAFPLLFYWLAALLFRPGEPRLRVTRRLSARRICAGAAVEMHVQVTNDGEWLDQVEIEDELPDHLNPDNVDGQRGAITALAPGDSISLTFTLRPLHGLYHFDRVHVKASEHLGLAAQAVTLSAPADLEVLPQVVRLQRIPIRPRYAGVYAGLIPTRQGGEGLAFFGVREYHPGDSLRHINWHASARHPEALFSSEFQRERATEVGLILDVRQRTHAFVQAAAFFEQAVAAVASLAGSFLTDGNRVGLMLYGRRLVDWTLPGYGKGQHERILQALMRAQLGETHAFDRLEYLPAHFFIPGSQIVFVSPMLREDLETLVRLRARGYAVWVISPNAVDYEAQRLIEQPKEDGEAVRLAARIARLERALLIRQLQQSGVPVFDWNLTIPIDQALRAFLRGAGRWLGAPL